MVTASAFLSAFVLSLLTFTFDNISELPGLETWAVWIALGGFLLAATFGLAVNWPVGYSEPTVGWLKKINEQEHWDDSLQNAAHRVNQSRLMPLGSYRAVNRRKARTVTAALFAETVGIASLATLVLALIY